MINIEAIKDRVSANVNIDLLKTAADRAMRVAIIAGSLSFVGCGVNQEQLNQALADQSAKISADSKQQVEGLKAQIVDQATKTSEQVQGVATQVQGIGTRVSQPTPTLVRMATPTEVKAAVASVTPLAQNVENIQQVAATATATVRLVEPTATVKPVEATPTTAPAKPAAEKTVAQAVQASKPSNNEAPAKVQGKPLFDECEGEKGKIIDGRVEDTFLADVNGYKRRHPVSFGGRRAVIEVGVEGKGFEHQDRAVFVAPEGGHTWTLNLRGEGDDKTPDAQVTSGRVLGFCGPTDAVESWAQRMHIDSLVQASRRWDGQEPATSEVTFGRFNYEGDGIHPEAYLYELKKGTRSIESWAQKFDLTFVDTDGKRAGQPIRGIPMGGAKS